MSLLKLPSTAIQASFSIAHLNDALLRSEYTHETHFILPRVTNLKSFLSVRSVVAHHTIPLEEASSGTNTIKQTSSFIHTMSILQEGKMAFIYPTKKVLFIYQYILLEILINNLFKIK